MAAPVRVSRRKPETPLEKMDPRFEGSRYSQEECAFLLDHLGEPAIVAMPPDEELPIGVNEVEVERILNRTYELELYQQSLRDRAKDDTLTIWCGFDRLRDILTATMEWRLQVQELKRRTKGSSAQIRLAANAPSLCMWDPSTDIPSMGGVGADAERTLTALTPDGNREELFTELRQTGEGGIKSLAGVASFIKATTQAEQSGRLLADTPEALDYDEPGGSYGAVSCPICHKAENYEVAKPNTKKLATAKIMKHLREEKHIKKDQHRLLEQRLKSGRAGAGTTRVPAGSTKAKALPEADEPEAMEE